MKTFGRIAVTVAASLALALAPAGIASASSVSAAPGDDPDDRVITLTVEQRTVVLSARSAYLTAAAGVRTSSRSAVEGILDEARAATAPAQLAYDIAKDAYAFTRATGGDATAAKTALDTAASSYKAALQSARAVARPKLDAARTAAREALATAASTYSAAVTGAVPSAPRALLVPPGRGKSWIGHGFGKDYGMDWGRLARR